MHGEVDQRRKEKGRERNGVAGTERGGKGNVFCLLTPV